MFDPPADWVDDELQQLQHHKRLQAIGKLEFLLEKDASPETVVEFQSRLASLRYEAGTWLLLRGDPAGGRQIEQASALFSAILVDHPSFDRADQALLFDARCRADLHDFQAARSRLLELQQRFPASMHAAEAARLLTMLP